MRARREPEVHRMEKGKQADGQGSAPSPCHASLAEGYLPCHPDHGAHKQAMLQAVVAKAAACA